MHLRNLSVNVKSSKTYVAVAYCVHIHNHMADIGWLPSVWIGLEDMSYIVE